MDIRQVSSQVVALLTVGAALSPSKSESTLLKAVEQVSASEEGENGDSLTIRLGNLALAQARLMKTSGELGVEQTRRTLVETVRSALGEIQAELGEVERMVEAVDAGEIAESEIGDVQEIIEFRLARIEEIAAQTRFGGDALLSGVSVRVMTDPITEEGFEVEYPEISAESLGLSDLDVETMDSGEALVVIAEASESLESLMSDVEEELAIIEGTMERGVSELGERFEALRSSERLGTAEETRWLEEIANGGGLSIGDLQVVLSSLKLDAEVVSFLLK